MNVNRNVNILFLHADGLCTHFGSHRSSEPPSALQPGDGRRQKEGISMCVLYYLSGFVLSALHALVIHSFNRFH